MFSSFVRVAACFSTLFWYGYTKFYPFISWWISGLFLAFGFMNTAGMNTVIYFLCRGIFSFILEVKFLGRHNRLLKNITEWMGKELVSNQSVPHLFFTLINPDKESSFFPYSNPWHPLLLPPASTCPNYDIFLPSIQRTKWNCREVKQHKPGDIDR